MPFRRVELAVARESTNSELSCRASEFGTEPPARSIQLSQPDASCHLLQPSFIQLSKLEATLPRAAAIVNSAGPARCELPLAVATAH